ncbi:sodium channel protein Nach isoform X2 [Eurosta solidaginis]|uniref:sodium channel protein Nach isoform X2 n=1 Tax=Eurosta solidaginis TaxID=178769 RepID=UPI003530E668
MKNRLRLFLKLSFLSVYSYLAWKFLAKSTLRLVENFIAAPVSFNMDTLYINWNTSFPALTVCEMYNSEKIWDLSEQYFGLNHDLKIDDFVSEVVFFSGACVSCAKCERMECPSNFTELLTLFRTKCSQLLQNCRYTNFHFDCCEEFLPIHTEYGICFAFNSNQARKNDLVRFANNRATGPGHLKFDVSVDIQLHIHSSNDVPVPCYAGMIRETILLGSTKEIIINVMEVYNDDSVAQLPLDQRRCRFSHETTEWGRKLGIYEFYSYPTCIVECGLALEMKYCNCSNHFIAPAVKYSGGVTVSICDYYGLSCLTRHYEEMQSERKSCDCISSCEEPEYNIVYSSTEDEFESDKEVTQVQISLIDLPTLRYVRRSINTPVDLLISVCGIIGLFFNASILRIIEILFYLRELKWSEVWERI